MSAVCQVMVNAEWVAAGVHLLGEAVGRWSDPFTQNDPQRFFSPVAAGGLLSELERQEVLPSGTGHCETRAFCAHVEAQRSLQVCSRKFYQDERRCGSREVEHSEKQAGPIPGSRNAVEILACLGKIRLW